MCEYCEMMTDEKVLAVKQTATTLREAALRYSHAVIAGDLVRAAEILGKIAELTAVAVPFLNACSALQTAANLEHFLSPVPKIVKRGEQS